MADVMDDFGGGGAPGFNFPKLGDVLCGVVTELSSRQDADYDTERPLWWSGKKKSVEQQQGARPVMVLILTIRPDRVVEDGVDGTAEIEDGEIRAVWCRGNLHTVVMDAFGKAYPGQKLRDEHIIGGRIEIRHHELGEKKPKLNPAKLYQARFKPGQVIEQVQPAAQVQPQTTKPAPTGTEW